MKTYTYSEARQNLSRVLDQVSKEGAVRIRRRDGRIFVIQSERSKKSALDVAGVDLDVTTAEIVSFIRESRREAKRA